MTDHPDAGSAIPDVLQGSGAATPDVLAVMRPKPPDALADVMTLYNNRPQYWGVPGEQDLAFILGQMGWNVVYGPGGKDGKSTFAKGIDYLGIKVDANGQSSLLIPDNKASGVPEQINECSALTDNIKTNLDTLLNKVVEISDFPGKTAAILKLTELIEAVKNGGHVDGVAFAISNAGGYAREPTESLQAEFAKASNLTNADGSPLRLGFIDTVSPSELANRVALIEQLGGNPRSATFASVTEPVIVDPARAALDPRPLGDNMEGAWLAGLMLIRLVITQILGLFPTDAEEAFKQLQPEILSKLNRDPSIAGVLLIYWALVERYSQAGDIDTAGSYPVNATFVRWEWQYGPSDDDAYSWWAAPAKIMVQPTSVSPPKRYEQYFWWFDRKATKQYNPGNTAPR